MTDAMTPWKLLPAEPTEDMAWNAMEEAGEHLETRNGWKEPAFAVYRAMVAAAPAPPEEGLAVPAWQPIETAPRDGTLVLLFVPYSALLEIVFGRFDVGGDGDDWLMDWGNEASIIDMPVTHWRPLPAAPAQAEGA